MEYNNIFEELVDRGYFEQATYEEELKEHSVAEVYERMRKVGMCD